MTTKTLMLAVFLTSTACGSAGTTITDAEGSLSPTGPPPTTSATFRVSSDSTEFLSVYDTDTDRDEILIFRNFSLRNLNGTGGTWLATGIIREGDVPEYAAIAELRPSTTIFGGTATTGTVSYSGGYVVYEVTDISTNPTSAETTGAITYTANFDDNMITGTSDLLTLAGTITDNTQDFGGTVTWRGVSGEVQGLVNKTQILGVIQGSDDDTIFAGRVGGGVQTR